MYWIQSRSIKCRIHKCTNAKKSIILEGILQINNFYSLCYYYLHSFMALEFLIYGCSVVNRIISNVMANGQLLDFRL